MYTRHESGRGERVNDERASERASEPHTRIFTFSNEEGEISEKHTRKTSVCGMNEHRT